MPTITAIEFTHTECRVAVAETGKGRPAIRHLIGIPIPRPDDAAERVEKRSALLRDALKNHKLKPGPVRVLIPKNEVMARMVTLPGTTDAELQGMARFEAERHIPFNPERHIVSHHVLARMGVQGSQVLLTAVDQPVAQEYLDTCTRAGLTVEQLSVGSLSMFNALSALKGPELADKVVALVNVGVNSTDFIIASNGVLHFTRSSSTGIARLMADLEEAGAAPADGVAALRQVDALEPQAFFRPKTRPAPAAPAAPPLDPYDSAFGITLETAAGEAATPTPEDATAPDNPGAAAFRSWLQRLVQEVRRTYDYARREFSCPLINRFYFTGEGTLIRNLGRYFEANMGTDGDVLDPLSGFELPAGAAADAQVLGPAAIALAGQFVQPTPHTVSVNLLPPDYMQKRAAKRQQQSLVTSGVMLLVLLVLAYIWASDRVKLQRESLAYLQERNREMKEQVEELESMRSRLQIMEKSFKDTHSAIKILDDISGLSMIPESITLTRFEYKKDLEVKIQGHAKTFADINRFRIELEKMGFFSEVRPDEGSGKPRVLPSRTEPIFEFFLTAKFATGDAARNRAAARPATRPAAAQEEPDEPDAPDAQPAADDAAQEESTNGAE